MSVEQLGQVKNEIRTIELPEDEVKKWWSKDEWKCFVQEFQERHPPVKQLEKEAPKASDSVSAAVPVKRKLEVDISKHLRDGGSAPGGVKVAQVQIINARFPADVKSQDLPTLVVSDGGPYVENATEHPVTCLTFLCIDWCSNLCCNLVLFV